MDTNYLNDLIKRANKVLAQNDKKGMKCGDYPAATCQQAEASMKKIFKAKMDSKTKSATMKCISNQLKKLKCRQQ